MKKILIGILIVIMCFSIVACGVQEEQPAAVVEEAEPTPEPTPEPPKTIAVVTDAESAELFMSGAEPILAESGCELINSALAEYADADAVVVMAYLANADADTAQLEAAVARGAQVVIYDATGTNAVDGAMYFDYDASGELETMMAETITYDLHDTPVRLFGLFTSAESEAYSVWTKYYGEGKVFPKAVYNETEQTETDLQDWLMEKLEGFYPGMLDAIYAENEELGLDAALLMEVLGREDAEVFIPGGSDQLITKMRQNPEIYAMTVGQNLCYAGAYTATAAVKALEGTVTENITFTPAVIHAENILDGNEGFFTEEMKQNYPY